LDQNTFSDQKTLLYSGPISPATSDFIPTITLKPASNATQPENGGDNVSIMADTIELVRNTTAASLVSILEYSPAIERSNHDGSIKSWKSLNRKIRRLVIIFFLLNHFCLEQLPLGSIVHSIDATNGDILYIGGLFSNTAFKNIVSYDINHGMFIPLDKSVVNAKVTKVLLHENSKIHETIKKELSKHTSNFLLGLYVAGDFNSTELDPYARYIVEYDTTKKTWNSLANVINELYFHKNIIYLFMFIGS
jgi:hypothetical protein